MTRNKHSWKKTWTLAELRAKKGRRPLKASLSGAGKIELGSKSWPSELSVGRVLVKYRSSGGRVAAEWRWSIGRVAVKYRPGVGLHACRFMSTDTRPTLGRHIDWPEFKADISDFIRRLRLHEYFYENDNNNSSDDNHNPFRVKSTFTRHPGREASFDAFCNTIEQQLLNARQINVRDNLTKRERSRRALKPLIRREDIIIRPADKSSGTIVMDMDWYENECLRQLNDIQFYEKLTMTLLRLLMNVSKNTFPVYNSTKWLMTRQGNTLKKTRLNQVAFTPFRKYTNKVILVALWSPATAIPPSVFPNSLTIIFNH